MKKPAQLLLLCALIFSACQAGAGGGKDNKSVVKTAIEKHLKEQEMSADSFEVTAIDTITQAAFLDLSAEHFRFLKKMAERSGKADEGTQAYIQENTAIIDSFSTVILSADKTGSFGYLVNTTGTFYKNKELVRRGTVQYLVTKDMHVEMYYKFN